MFITKPIKLSEMAGYGVGNLGYGLITQTITSYLVFYATVILKLPGSLIGLIVSISIIWDAVSDPIMGYFSDNTISKFGRRHLYILLGTISIAITNVVLWNVMVDLDMWVKLIWILVGVLLIKTFVTVFITPYSALGAELSKDYNERSMIQAIKTIFFLVAFLMVSAGSMFVFFRPTQEYPIGQLNPQAYSNIALTASIVMFFTGMITYYMTKKFIPFLPTAKIGTSHNTRAGFVEKIKFSLLDRDYRDIFLGYLFTNLASAIASVVGLHTFTYTFHLNNYQIGIVLGTQFAVSILAQPVWARIASKIDKKNAVKLGLKLSIFACSILFGLVVFRNVVHLHYEYLLIYSVVIGFGSSGLFSLPLSMIADTVDQQEYQTGERNEGVYYGLLNFGYKISQAIAILVLGVVLDLVRFDSSYTVQLSFTEFFLGSFLSVGCMLAFIMALLAYKKYRLDRETVVHMQIEIEARIEARSKTF